MLPRLLLFTLLSFCAYVPGKRREIDPPENLNVKRPKVNNSQRTLHHFFAVANNQYPIEAEEEAQCLLHSENENELFGIFQKFYTKPKVIPFEK